MRKSIIPALLIFSAAAGCQDAGVGLRMHRQKAGKVDSSGWTVADSTEGNFSVKLPCPFSDFTIAAAEAGNTVKMFFLMCTGTDQRKFSAMRNPSDDEADAKRVFEASAAKPAWPDAKISRSVFKGLPTIDATLDNDETYCAFSRQILAGRDNLALMVEGPKAACADLKKQTKEFYESLAIKPNKP